MDFRNRSGRPAQPAQTVAPGGSVQSSHQENGNNNKKTRRIHSFVNPLNLLLLLCVAIVVLGMTWLVIFFRAPQESRHVDGEKLQAVFLEGGQVYFGHITNLNEEYIRLNDIYYLRVNQQVQPKQEAQEQATAQDISLVKLGCELHGPQDQMIINRSNVIFWENLKDDGQVGKAVAQFKQANPDGQKCEQPQQNNSGSNSNGNSDQSQQQTETTPPANGAAQ